MNKASSLKNSEMEAATAEHDYATVCVRLIWAFGSQVDYHKSLSAYSRALAGKTNDVGELRKTLEENTEAMTDARKRLNVIFADIPTVTSHKRSVMNAREN